MKFWRTPKGKIVEGKILDPKLFNGNKVYGKSWIKRHGQWQWTIRFHLHDLGEVPVEVCDPSKQ